MNLIGADSTHLHSMNSLTAICVEEIANAIASGQDVFEERIGNLLPGEICEILIQNLAQKGSLNDETLGKVMSPYISNLFIGKQDNYNALSPTIIDHALKMCKTLQRFGGNGQEISSSSIDYLLSPSFHTEIRELNLSGCNISNTQFLKIMQSFYKMETLSLAAVPGVCFPLTNSESNNKKRKRTLEVNSTTKVQKLGYEFSYAIQPSIGQMSLKHLNFSGCENLTNHGIMLLADMCPLLEVLDISHCRNITDITPILVNCQYIKELILDDCPIVSHPFKSDGHLKYLKKLKFSGTGFLNDSFLDWFTYCGKTLESLSLRNKTHLREKDDSKETEKISEIFTCIIAEMADLKELDLYGCNFGFSLIQLLSKHKRLRKSLVSLDVTSLDEISTSELFMTLCNPKVSPFDNLESLSIPGCKPEPFEARVDFMHYTFPSLVDLCIHKMKNYKGIRQIDLAKMLTGFPHLTSLKVWCCSSISYSLTNIIPQIVKSIKSLVLCAEDASVHTHVDAEKSKESENVNTNFLTQEQMNRLSKDHPQIEFKIWRHTIRGKPNFQHINPKYPCIPESKLEIHVQNSMQNSNCSLKVNHLPIWTNEKSVNFNNLMLTLGAADNYKSFQGGTIPLVEDWCCSCNVDEFNGVLFYSDDSHIYWEIHEPGPQAVYKFEKNHYRSTMESALLKINSVDISTTTP